VTAHDLEAGRFAVRRRALANLLLGLLAVARRSEGRLAVERGDPQTVVLRYRDVRTLVRTPAGFALAARDFTILVALPELWPFERAEAPIPMVLAPDDFAHPNSDGRLFCLDTRGVGPARLATLVYDNLRLAARRLDHPVSQPAADWVRAHLRRAPADVRPLVPVTAPAAAAPAVAPPSAVVRAGVLGVALPEPGASILRFGGPAGETVDRARSAYLRAAARELRSGTPVWDAGPVLAVAAGAPRAVVDADARELARTLDALGDPAIAASYLEVARDV